MSGKNFFKGFFMRLGLITAVLSVLCACAAPSANKTAKTGATVAKATAVQPSKSAAQIAAETDYMIQLQDMLSKTLNGTSFTMKRDGSTVTLTLSGSAAFSKNSYNVLPKGVADLKKIAPVLRYYDKTQINVVGHTAKEIGVKDATNRLLSQKRAEKTASVLTSAGIKPERFWINAKGSDNPVATNDTPAGRERNNRMEIVLTPALR